MAEELDQYWRTVSGLHPFAVSRRVLHVTTSDDDGVAAYCASAATFMTDGGWDVSSVRVSDRGDVKDAMATCSPEVVVLHGGKAGWLGRGAVRGSVPTVYLPHVWPFVSLPSAWAAGAVAWERRAARWTSLIIAVSEAQASVTAANGIHAPMGIVPNGVPAGWRPFDQAAKRAARQRLGLPDAPLAVSVGRLSKQKGHDVLLAGWPAVTAEVPAATLAIVGDGPERDRLARQAPPSATLVGAVADPRDWVAAADVVVFPSRWEGMSLAMLEALAAARSVVITAVAGSEVVAKAEAGAVVPVGNTAALADALTQRLSGAVNVAGEGARGAAHVQRSHDRTGCLLRLAAYVSRAHVFGVPSDRD